MDHFNTNFLTEGIIFDTFELSKHILKRFDNKIDKIELYMKINYFRPHL